jgi:hypothetical protein
LNIANRSGRTAFLLDFVPGFLGLFGIGELYLGKRLRGELFLIWTAGLYISVLLTFISPNLSFWGYLPIAWGLGYLLLLFDIYTLTKQGVRH